MVRMLEQMDSALSRHPFGDRVHYVNATKAFDSTTGDCFIDEVHLNAEGMERLLAYIVQQTQAR